MVEKFIPSKPKGEYLLCSPVLAIRLAFLEGKLSTIIVEGNAETLVDKRLLCQRMRRKAV